MKNYVGLIIIVVLVVVIYFEFKPNNNLPESAITSTAATSMETVDFTASFAIFTHGTLRNFSNAMYHNLSPDVYIQADNPSSIYVKKSGVTWDDFFKTLPMKVARDCLTTGTGEKYCNGQGGALKFYLNGKQVTDLLTREINNGDTLLITYGFETEEQIKLQQEQIKDPSSSP